MAIRYALTAALLFTATPALAEPVSYRLTPELRHTQQVARRWEQAYLALSAIDGAQTIYCINVTKRCTEGNPLLGKHPSTFKIIAVKVGTGALQYGLFTYLNDRDPRTALRAAQISVALQGSVVGLNMRVIF